MSVNGLYGNVEKTSPGCLGRMANLFELNVGVSRDRLLTDKPLCDGSHLSRCRSDVAQMNPVGDRIEDKLVKFHSVTKIVSDFRSSYSNRKSNGTPMKMLIAQEMSKELESRRSPNVVAKLMGLETLSMQENDSTVKGVRSRSHRRSLSEIPMSSWEQQNVFFHYAEPNEFTDVHETYQKSQYMGRCNETTFDKRLSLVRQKFAEAKRLSMDEKLRQSKQFHDALEVLNTNKDLFLKCLQEPNTVLSQDVYTLQSIPPHPETKRITVLRPSKMADNIKFGKTVSKDENQSKKGVVDRLNGFEKSQLVNFPPASWKNYNNTSQPTRIVILKPSPVKLHDIKAVISPESKSPVGINGEEFFVANDRNQESRDVAKAITQQMRGKFVRHHKEEALISSVFSNGYTDAESSFDNSETEYTAGNGSDAEIMSPVSRHSWDYVNNRFGSPYSSSFSRVSYSPESSVCREAKKRLSERWALVTSNGSFLDQRLVRRSSSTLGEMLALSETKIVLPREEVCVKELNLTSTNDIESRTHEHVCHSPRNLTRSKSVPVSFVDGTRLNDEESVSQWGGMVSPKEETKGKHVKFSFKGKVSSLFFSRKKKACKDKSPSSDSKNEFHSDPVSGQSYSHRNASCSDEGPKHLFSSNQVGNLGALWPETELPTGKLNSSGSTCDNLDQPSLVSVLDQPLEEDPCAPTAFTHRAKSEEQGVELPFNSIRSNLIEKSLPIWSIARILSWDDSCVDSISSYSLNQSTGREIEERDWLLFVRTLLSTADMLGEVQLNSFLARWHSLDSPLDPSLRDNYIDWKDKEPMHEAWRRKKRSTQKLIFDCVNSALVEISGYGSIYGQRAIPCINFNNNILENATFTILDEVWTQMTKLFCGGIKCAFEDFGDDNSLILERVVRKEVAGKGWDDHIRSVADNIGKELEEKVLEELVQEAMVELTGRV